MAGVFLDDETQTAAAPLVGGEFIDDPKPAPPAGLAGGVFLDDGAEPVSSPPAGQSPAPAPSPASPSVPVNLLEGHELPYPDFRPAIPIQEVPEPKPVPKDNGNFYSNPLRVAGAELAKAGDLTVQGVQLQPVLARAQAEKDVDAARKELEAFKAEWDGQPDPMGDRLRVRNSLVTKLSVAEGEAARLKEIVPDPAAVVQDANFWRDSAAARNEEYGVNPALAESKTSKVAGGVAKGLGLAAQGMVPFVGLPLVVAQSTMESGAAARNQAAAAGLSEDAQNEAADKAQAWAMLSTAAFMGQATLINGTITKVLSAEASPAATFLSQLVGGSLGNEATARLTSAAHAAEAAPAGARFAAAKEALLNTDAGQLAQSIGFGALGAAHAAGAVGKAAEARAAQEFAAANHAEALDFLMRRQGAEVAGQLHRTMGAPDPVKAVVEDLAANAETIEVAGLPVTAAAVRQKAEEEKAKPAAEAPSESAAPAEAPAPAPGEAAPAESTAPAPAETPAPSREDLAKQEIHRPEADLLEHLTGRASTPVEVLRPAPEPEAPAAPFEPVATESEVKGLAAVEVPLDRLTLSSDVPQFKKGADEKGVVQRLEGKFDRTGTAPIQVWERLDGRLEVISGRHRFDLARRSLEETIPSQIHREADGFDQRAAARLDAELNIRDEQGSGSDYANYFRNSGLSEADARSRGLLGRPKGRAGFAIARGASKDVFELHQAGRISDAQAEALAGTAPGNDAVQRLGLRAMQAGASVGDAANAMRAALLYAKGEAGTQLDFFSGTGLEEQWLAQGKVASAQENNLREQIAAVQGAAKRPEQARRLGVDIKDPEGVQKRIEALRAELARWENWPAHPDLVAMTRSERVSDSSPTIEAKKSDSPPAKVPPAEEKPAEVPPEMDEAIRQEAEAAALDRERQKRLDEENGSLFGSKTPKTPEAILVESINAAAAKAPSHADLDAMGRQPGTVEFSRPSGAGKIIAQNTKEALAALAAKYRPSGEERLQEMTTAGESIREAAKGVKLHLWRTEADLPESLKQRIEPGTIHEGIVDTATGDVHLFMDNIRTPERMREVFAHEVVGHFGVSKILPYSHPGWQRVADSVFKLAPSEALKIAKDYVKKHPRDFTPADRAKIAAEYVARLAERPAENPTVWQQAVDLVRSALRRLGIVREWTEADIRALLRSGAKAIDAKMQAGEEGSLFASVRDLGPEVEKSSPFAHDIEQAFEAAVPGADARAAVTEYVKARLAGDEVPLLAGADLATAEKFVSYFSAKTDFARRNGVDHVARAALERTAGDSSTLPERLAIFSREVNDAVQKRVESGTVPKEPRTGDPTSIKNERVDTERRNRGLPPAMEPARRAFGRAWDDAMVQLSRDSTAAERLVAELEAAPRALTDTEDALLLHRQVELQNTFDALTADYVRQSESGAEAAAEATMTARNRVSESLLDLYNAGKAAGTETGRGLNARKMLANEDFTLAKMVTEKRVANGGKPLTPAQQAEVETLFNRIDLAQKRLDAFREKEDAARSTAAADEAVKRMAGEARRTSPKPKKPAGEKVVDKVLDSLAKKASEARARIRERSKRANLPGDLTALYDYAVVGAEMFARGSVSLGRFTAKMVLEFGESIRPHIPDIFRKAKEIVAEERSNRDLPKERASILNGIKDRLDEGDTIADLPAYVRKLALNLVRSGIGEREALIDAVHADIQSFAPDVTRRQAMDLISGYGDFKSLDPEAAKQTLRDLKGQMQQIGKIEDMAGGKAPRKTGVQRRDVSAEESRLLKEVNEAKKRGGFEVTDPASQLRTALQAKQRALENEIRAVMDEINSGVLRAKPGTSPENETIKALRDQLAALREQRAAIFGKSELSDEQRLKLAITAADRSAAEYERQSREADFKRKTRETGLDSPELQAAKARRDAARAERDELKALDAGVKQQKEEARTKQLEDQIAEIDQKLREGDTDPERPAARLLTSEQEALVSQRDAMLRLLGEIRRNPKPDAVKQVERLLKQIDELDRRLREGDLSKAKGKVTPLSPEAESLMSMRDAMSRELADQRAAEKPRLTDAEIALKRWKSAAARRIAELQTKFAAGDFAPKPERMPLALDKEGTDIAFELEKAKEDFIRGKFEDMLRRRSVPRKILGTVSEVVNTARATMTAFDLSAVLRQGGFIALARPGRALRAFPSMFRAFASEKGEFAVMAEIRSRPNADLYRQAKLDIAQPGTSLTKMEEAYMSRWAEDAPIPEFVQKAFPRATAAVKRLNPVAASSRAYRTFLNRLRADSFDALVRSFSAPAGPTLAEARALANFVNVATGRGALGSTAATVAVGLNHVMFAPRLVLSRFQLLAGQPFYGGTGATRRAIAGEYARYLLGVGLIIALAKSAGGDVEKDPRSAAFAKLRFGNTRIDPFSGLVQATVVASRLATLSTKTNSGNIVPLRVSAGAKRKFGQDDVVSVLGRFLRSKLSPIFGTALDAASGTNVIGEKVTPATAASRLFVPLTFGEVYDSMKEQGMPAGAALGVLSVFGAAVQNYDSSPKKKP